MASFFCVYGENYLKWLFLIKKGNYMIDEKNIENLLIDDLNTDVWVSLGFLKGDEPYLEKCAKTFSSLAKYLMTQENNVYYKRLGTALFAIIKRLYMNYNIDSIDVNELIEFIENEENGCAALCYFYGAVKNLEPIRSEE